MWTAPTLVGKLETDATGFVDPASVPLQADHRDTPIGDMSCTTRILPLEGQRSQPGGDPTLKANRTVDQAPLTLTTRLWPVGQHVRGGRSLPPDQLLPQRFQWAWSSGLQARGPEWHIQGRGSHEGPRRAIAGWWSKSAGTYPPSIVGFVFPTGTGRATSKEPTQGRRPAGPQPWCLQRHGARPHGTLERRPGNSWCLRP
jgi:hypothetical protein